MRRSLFLLPVLLVEVYSQAFFHRDGTQIFDLSGSTFIAKGLALSGWLNLEAYILRVNDVHKRHLNTHSDIRENVERILGSTQAADTFWQTFHDNFVTASDISNFAQQGFNAIRVPFNYRLLSPEDTPGVYSNEGFAVLDKVIGWCASNQIAVLLDMHACPGGQSHEPYADPEYSYWYQESGVWKERGVPVLFEDNAGYTASTGRTPAFNQQRTADIWREIASRYSNESWILGYELANEPYFHEESNVTTADLRNFFMSVTAAIREVDTNHIVFVEGNDFAESTDGLLPPWDTNMAIAVHRCWRETGYLDGRIQEYLNARTAHSIPLLLTEFGENSNVWLYEMKELMEENNIGWFAWGYKKVHSIATAYEAAITEDYQYVIDNWKDNNSIDALRATKGLMEMANSVSTSACRVDQGYFAALVSQFFGSFSMPYTEHFVPGTVYAVHYDVGSQGVAYSDTRYKNEEYMGEAWNNGWEYRNDGVDIAKTTTDTHITSNGYHVQDFVAGEKMVYTVLVLKGDYYSPKFRARVQGSCELQLSEFGFPLTSTPLMMEGTGDWVTYEFGESFYLIDFEYLLDLEVVHGELSIAWIEFVEFVPVTDVPF